MNATVMPLWRLYGRAGAALAAMILGLLLLLVSMAAQTVAVVTGIGASLVGLVLMLFPSSEFNAWLTRISGGALLIAGVLMATWPDAGAPWLALLLALALMAHGALTVITAFRGDHDHRITALLTGLASLCFGWVAFSWPVLTIALFKLGVGAWLVFIGVRLLLDTWHIARPSSLSPTTGDAQPSAASEHAPTASRAHRAPRARRWARSVGAGLALLLALGAAYGSAQLFAGTPLPRPDAFYTPPTQIPKGPGQLIRTEPLTVGVPAGAEAWKMLYTTTHPDGSATVASGTILAPAQREKGELPLLTVSHGTTGVIDGCAPSLSATPFADGAGTAMAELVTDHGWVAVTSDYTGMGTAGTAAYLVGEAEARNVLDASRAARQFEELSLSGKTVVWGHSQGGQGSLWTGQLAATYAPELTVLGIGAFAPAADLYGLADADKNTAPGKTVSAYIAATWNDLYPELELHSHLTPGSVGPVERISQLCFNGSDALSAIILGTQVPNQVFPDELLAGPFGDQLKAQTPTGPFPAPVLVAQGLDDPLVLPRLQQGWVNDRCESGEVIDYRTFEGLSHVSLVAADSPLTPQLVEWTLDRWSGVPAPTACTTQTFPQAARS